MRDGIYKVRIVAPKGVEQGICLISEGHIAGGNKTHYFTGGFTVEHERLTGRMTAKRYTPWESVPDLPQLDEFHVSMSGIAFGDYAQVREEIVEYPGLAATVSYSRICDFD